nr:hypothetical protein [Tanacetum cinerariifolium]
ILHPYVVSNIMKHGSDKCGRPVTELVKFIRAHQPVPLELVKIDDSLRVVVCSVWCQVGDVRSSLKLYASSTKLVQVPLRRLKAGSGVGGRLGFLNQSCFGHVLTLDLPDDFGWDLVPLDELDIESFDLEPFGGSASCSSLAFSSLGLIQLEVLHLDPCRHGTCTSLVELAYNFKDYYTAITNPLDWNNPEGHEYPFDLSKPLPLIEAQGHQAVPTNYFFNNDLEYLK